MAIALITGSGILSLSPPISKLVKDLKYIIWKIERENIILLIIIIADSYS